MVLTYTAALFTVVFVHSVNGNVTITKLNLNATFQHPDNLFYDNRTNRLYIDDRGSIYCYDIANETIASIKVGKYSSPILPLRRGPGVFLIGMNSSLEILEWSGKGEEHNRTVLTTLFPNDTRKQFNDGTADKYGRAWLGLFTFTGNESLYEQGYVYKVVKRNIVNPEVVIHNITDAEGFSFNKASTKLYIADTRNRRIFVNDFDAENGTISKPRIVFNQTNAGINASSAMVTMAGDSDDYLWVGLYRSGMVVKIDPNKGTVKQSVKIPLKLVISLTWGGANLDKLYVSAANVTDTGDGAVYVVTGLGSHGELPYEVDL